MKRQGLLEWLWVTCDWKISSGRMKGKRTDFDAFPCQIDLYRDGSLRQVVMKSAQMAISEHYTLQRPFYYADVYGGNWGILFPTQTAMRNFYKTRIKGVLAENPYIRRACEAENESNITVFKREIYLRYTTTTTAIATFDSDGVTVDEQDLHNQGSLYGAKTSRTQGAMEDTFWHEVSTPTFPAFGIHQAFLNSDQHTWVIKCGHCGRENDLTKQFGPFPVENLEEFFTDFLSEEKFPRWQDYFIPCSACGKPLDPAGRFDPAKPSAGGGRWVARYPNRDERGYHLQIFQRLYRGGTPDVLRRVRRSLLDAQNPEHVRGWWNYTIGMPFQSREGKLHDDDLDRVTTGQFIDSWARDPVYPHAFLTGKGIDWMGVDVRAGQYHFFGLKRTGNDQALLSAVGWVKDSAEVFEFWKRHGRPVFVIDANPDTNDTRRLVEAMGRRGRRAQFARGTNTLWQESGSKELLIVNRARIMEATKAMVESQSWTFPRQAWEVGAGTYQSVGGEKHEETLRDHFKAPTMVRSYSDASANEEYDFPHAAMGGVDPHFFMAACLAYIASQLQAAPAYSIIVPA